MADSEERKNLLITGKPRSGKTTLAKAIAQRLKDLKLGGFYTEEILSGRRRVGFEAVGFSGARARLAHVEFESSFSVGRYGVALSDFDQFLQREIREAQGVDLFMIDEIGKMECYSRTFVRLVSSILEGEMPLCATVSLTGEGFIEDVKRREDVRIFTASPGKIDSLADEVSSLLLAFVGRQ